MTTPQGPYGPFEPQQNPYAQQPSGSPYPQHPQQYPQHQQPPYGYPQQPGTQFPGTQPPGMPGWPTQQPPRRKRTGLIVGIVVGAVVVAGGIAFGASLLVEKGADAAFPEASHKLVVEKKLLDGEFTLSNDMSETEGRSIEDTPDPSIRDGEAVVAQYAAKGGDVLVLSGMYGRLASPGFMRGKIMEGAAEGEGAKVVVPAKEFTPDGYDITIECQVVQSDGIGGPTNMPMCAWGDDNTAAMVAVLRVESLTVDPKTIDLEAAAAEAATIRTEIRKPIG